MRFQTALAACVVFAASAATASAQAAVDRPVRRFEAGAGAGIFGGGGLGSAGDDAAATRRPCRVEPASHPRRERIQWRRLAASARRTRRVSAPDATRRRTPAGPRCAASNVCRIGRCEPRAGPTRGHARSGQLTPRSETSDHAPVPDDAADSLPTHKPTTKQPFENLLSEKKRTVNLFLRSLLLG